MTITKGGLLQAKITKAERLQALRALTTSGKARDIRVAARLTQGEVARSVGVHYSAISRWESGEHLPTGESALRYAALLERLASAVKA
jgi:DNA-binding transcriptional regulator YiaG